MNRLIAIALAISIAYLLPPQADAAILNASVVPLKSNCAAFGDPLCSGGQVLNDPMLAGNFSSNLNATRSSVAVADFSYVDPRIGTANSTSGSVMAGLGVLRAISGSSVSSSPPLATGSLNLMRLGTFSTARFSDTVTIMPGSAALIGTTGTMTASFLVSGSLQTTGVNGKPGTSAPMASAAWRMQVTVGNNVFGSSSSFVNGFFGFESVDVNGVVTSSGVGEDAVVSFVAPFVFGTPFTLGASFSAETIASMSAAVARPLTEGLTLSSADSLYLNTATWDGIQTIRSGNQVIADFTVTSGSGINYAEPVPEPQTVALLFAGLLVLGWIQQRWGQIRATRR